MLPRPAGLSDKCSLLELANASPLHTEAPTLTPPTLKARRCVAFPEAFRRSKSLVRRLRSGSVAQARRGRPLGSFKVPDIDDRMKCFCREGSWHTRLCRPKRFLQGAKTSVAARVGLHRTQSARRVKKLGCMKSKIRGGLCDYCYQWKTQELPLNRKIVQVFEERLETLGCDVYKRWQDRSAADPRFSAPEFEPFASAVYWRGAIDFMRAESSNVGLAARPLIATFCDKWLEEGGRQSVISGFQGHLLSKLSTSSSGSISYTRRR